MVRPALQVLILPLLFALLGAGGNTTFCAVLSAIGLNAHHHLYHDGEEANHAGPFCLHSHDEEEDHGHHHGTVPCPEACDLRLSEAPAPGLVKVPTVVVAILLPALFEISAPVDTVPGAVPSAFPDPPDRKPDFSVPSFTGRFLI